MSAPQGPWRRAASLEELRARPLLPVQLDGHTLVLVQSGERVHALDSRCPHMGFPLHRGTVEGGILTCHWHHARFDLETGGTFDPWADDVRVYPARIRDGEVWVDLRPGWDRVSHYRRRLGHGLERSIPLVLAKAVIHLLEAGIDPAVPLRSGLEFGVRHRETGWGQGLTMLTCFHNLLPHLDPEERPRALYHGLSAVARDTAGMAPHFPLEPLAGHGGDLSTLKRWLRSFVEVRDAEGAERCVLTAVECGADSRQMADLFFSAATDYRYLQTGHVLDFSVKALEALDAAGWDLAGPVLASLVSTYARAERMEESNAWRNPVDLVALLEEAFDRLPPVEPDAPPAPAPWAGEAELVPVLLAEDPAAIVRALLQALSEGATADQLAGAVTYAAALRIARFHRANEFSDWDTALHTFTFANAVHQGMRRAPSRELLRGVFDAALSVYLDRFLNVPPAPLPQGGEVEGEPQDLLAELPDLLDRQQQVDAVAARVAAYLGRGGEPGRLLAVLGRLLLREDRDFHTIQAVEAAFAQHRLRQSHASAPHFLIAASRYLAAHAPTPRSQGQTYGIALRLHRGEALHEEA